MSEPALEALLNLFPAHTHPLTLVSDPDELLVEAEVSAALKQRGFQMLLGEDFIQLRLELRQIGPLTTERPVIIVTKRELNSLPYDLWQQGRRLTVSLATCWPGLAVGVLRALTSSQRRLLGNIPTSSAARTLSVRETQDLALQRIFGFDSQQITTRAALVRWLAVYHAGPEQLSPELAEHVLMQLRTIAYFANWPLERLINSREFFHKWVQRGWEAYLASDQESPATTRPNQVSQPRLIKEISQSYTMDGELYFANDPALQDALGTLVRYKAISPVVIPSHESSKYAFWTQPGIVVADAQIRETQLDATLAEVEVMLATGLKDWPGWQQLAVKWAEIAGLRYQLDLERAFPSSLSERYKQAEGMLDDSFVKWLTGQYAQLAGRGLPTPHHLFHIPARLAYDLRQAPQARVALLILDGLSLADWQLMRSVWQPRHPDWLIAETSILAQVPSITAISRQALIGGMRPTALTRALIEQPREEQAWKNFWQGQSLPPEGSSYARLPDVIGAEYPIAVITSRRTRALCLISTVIDNMVHGATQGAAGVYAALTVWLSPGRNTQQHERTPQQGSAWMEGLIDLLLAEGYTVTLTGDHGHVEALGIGIPQEGVLASTRSKRTRLYSSLELAENAAAQLSDTIVIDKSWLRPQDMFPIVTLGRTAYASKGERVVTHGGLTIEEMIVPLITLERKKRE